MRSETLDAPGRRLLWRCRRGMKELDILLECYAREALPGASQAERATFAALLALPDPLLAGYLLGGDTPGEEGLARLVGRIRGLCRSGGGAGVF
ncbi:MAG TPA: succinate dehydrogenase assembly factor 2 [Steroidobacteraceae bacterium]|jgi:antitoxin CptB|nr:succinate dehydrogenase assembly factor 2 [Steroidobacteraceae bacterium]